MDEDVNNWDGEMTETKKSIEASYVTGPLGIEIKASLLAGCRLILSLSPWFGCLKFDCDREGTASCLRKGFVTSTIEFG